MSVAAVRWPVELSHAVEGVTGLIARPLLVSVCEPASHLVVDGVAGLIAFVAPFDRPYSRPLHLGEQFP
ncbi:hypothetical protein ACPXB3_22300, partial [Gordonia sp. DT219]|uniref:hypothetical protein n=1 Tax=Gordonia sp. DT219 TaxID=3416658 RepID=UPI003CF6F6AA